MVDGRTAFTGGINVTDEENDALGPHAYRDLHMRIEGQVVRNLQLVFIEDWIYATGQGREAFARQVLFSGGQTIPSIVLNTEPIGTQRRPDINLVDVRFERSFDFWNAKKLSTRINVYNILNASTATNLNARAGSTYLRPTAILPARIMELNVTYNF